MAQHSVITIGNFDGVHLGHVALLQRARQLGQEHCWPVRAITFDPHPATTLRPGNGPANLTSRSERIEALRAAGADQVEVLASTAELLSLGPEQFLRQIVGRHAPAALVEGPHFRFGKDRAGDVHTMKSLGPRLGFDVDVIDRVHVSLCDQCLVPVSSSLVRWLLVHGRVGDAARCLGRPYRLSGRVVTGDRQGTSIGFPTANIEPQACMNRLIPGNGVYAGMAHLSDGSVYPAAVSVGHKPTFDGQHRVVEAHLLDFNGDLYGSDVAIDFSRWLRDQQPFPGVQALCHQLYRDKAQTRQWADMALLDLPRDATGVHRNPAGE